MKLNKGQKNIISFMLAVVMLSSCLFTSQISLALAKEDTSNVLQEIQVELGAPMDGVELASTCGAKAKVVSGGAVVATEDLTGKVMWTSEDKAVVGKAAYGKKYDAFVTFKAADYVFDYENSVFAIGDTEIQGSDLLISKDGKMASVHFAFPEADWSTLPSPKVTVKAENKVISANGTVALTANLEFADAKTAKFAWYQGDTLLQEEDGEDGLSYVGTVANKGTYTYKVVATVDEKQYTGSVTIYVAPATITVTVGRTYTMAQIGKAMFNTTVNAKATKINHVYNSKVPAHKASKVCVSLANGGIAVKGYCKNTTVTFDVAGTKCNVGIITVFPTVSVKFYINKKKNKISCVYANSKNAAAIKVQYKAGKKWTFGNGSMKRGIKAYLSKPNLKKSECYIKTPSKYTMKKFRVWAIYKTDFGKIATDKVEVGLIKTK